MWREQVDNQVTKSAQTITAWPYLSFQAFWVSKYLLHKQILEGVNKGQIVYMTDVRSDWSNQEFKD